MYITSKAWARLNVMRKSKFVLDRSLETTDTSFIRPILEYADVNSLEKVQIEAARIVTGTTKFLSIAMVHQETG